MLSAMLVDYTYCYALGMSVHHLNNDLPALSRSLDVSGKALGCQQPGKKSITLTATSQLPSWEIRTALACEQYSASLASRDSLSTYFSTS